MGQTGGSQIGGSVAQQQAQHATDLFNLGEPGVRLALNDLLTDLGKPGQEPASVTNAFDKIQKQTESTFAGASEAAPLTIQQQMRQSGYRGSANAFEGASAQALAQIEAARRQSLSSLQAQRSNAAVSQKQFDLSQILGIAQGSIGGSFGNTQNLLQLAGMDNQNPGGGALSGALSGASIGTSINPGWGTLIGAAGGALAGYFGSGG